MRLSTLPEAMRARWLFQCVSDKINGVRSSRSIENFKIRLFWTS